MEDDLEFIKPSRTRRHNTSKTIRDSEFKGQMVENKKKSPPRERFVVDYVEEYEEYLGGMSDCY